MSTYTAEEVAKVLQADGDRDGHLWYLALSGLRMGEVGGLRWPNVDQVDKTLSVRVSRVAAAGRAVESGPKTKPPHDVAVFLANIMRRVGPDV
jgi:integrase